MRSKYKTLEEKIKDSTNWNLSRVKFVSYLIISMHKTQSVSFVKLSQGIHNGSLLESNYRRIQRFFSQFDIDFKLIALLIYSLLPDKKKLRLSLDRSNWKFGKLNVNILMLSVCYKGLAIPLLWELLPKRGNSNFQERKDLIDRYLELFGSDSIDCLPADREFIGKSWFEYLSMKNITFYIRIRNNMDVQFGRNKRIKSGKLFFHKKYDVVHQFPEKVMITSCKLSVWGMKYKNMETVKTEHIIIVSNCSEGNGIEIYKDRWQIETLFRALKSSGFNLEDIHLVHIERIKKLIAIMAIAYIWAYKTGIFIHENIKQIKIKKFKKAKTRRQYSFFKYGLMHLTHALLNSFKSNEFKRYCKLLSCT
ncbi:MAG: IS4 family transposase [Bacteroidales bacterium]